MPDLDYLRSRLIWLTHITKQMKHGRPLCSWAWFTYYRPASEWCSGLKWPGI